MRHFAPLLALLAMPACSPDDAAASKTPSAIRVAHLGREGGDAGGFDALRTAFRAANPGYDVEWHAAADSIGPAQAHRIAFVQAGPAAASAALADGSTSSPEQPLDVGDVVILRPGDALAVAAPLSSVVFTVPDPVPAGIPTFVRPDWDPDITDTPGGCAEETGAYRRILLTWLESVGPYVFHGLNCHRVRITDSFSHYHPLDGGFDEFYLVQMVQPDAVLYTSDETERIEDPARVTAEEAATLLDAHPLAVGDLVYLPRGTVHRGFGGVLAQIITTPGFRPGAEIGVDHHLRAINENLALAGEEALPYREASSVEAVVK